MSQKSLLAFAIALILASSGCLGFGDDELEQQENDDNEKQEPVGETNMTSLEKRIEHLESTIAEYELPKVYFLDLSENDYSWASYMTSFPDYEFYKSDDGYLSCYYSERYDIAITSCNLNALYYDVDGMIEAYSWDGSESEIEYTGMCQENTDPLICLIGTGGTGWIAQDVCTLTSVNQILTLTVYDNDGNSASASYDLDYDSACTVEEPDNEGGTDFCDDGEEKIEGGMIWSCIEGEWEAMASIVCGSNEFVSNHTCVPCPEGTTNEAGDPAPHSDTTCDENEPPIIWSFTFVPGTITNETSQFGTSIDAEDPENDTLSVSAVLLLNGQEVYSVYSEDWVSFILDISEYDIVVGDELSVIVTVMDSLGQSTTATHTVVVEEPE